MREASVRVGERNGVEWVAHREPGETDAQFEAKVARMQKALGS